MSVRRSCNDHGRAMRPARISQNDSSGFLMSSKIKLDYILYDIRPRKQEAASLLDLSRHSEPMAANLEDHHGEGTAPGT